jgi:predicted lipoprotein with Yx(FWY)xxD motif
MKLFVTMAAMSAVVAGAALAQGEPSAQLAANQMEPFGKIVTDAEGRALYMFTADKKGQSSACYDACAQAWPPLLTQDQPELGAGIKKDIVGTISRKDGSKQVTYNGWPLYYFVQDKAAGQVAGQDKHGFGGEWYVVSAAGEVVKTEQKAQAGEKKAGRQKQQ